MVLNRRKEGVHGKKIACNVKQIHLLYFSTLNIDRVFSLSKITTPHATYTTVKTDLLFATKGNIEIIIVQNKHLRQNHLLQQETSLFSEKN